MEKQRETNEEKIPKRWTDHIGLFGALGILIVIFSGGCSIYYGYILAPLWLFSGGEAAQGAAIISLFAYGIPAVGVLLLVLDWRRK